MPRRTQLQLLGLYEAYVKGELTEYTQRQLWDIYVAELGIDEFMSFKTFSKFLGRREYAPLVGV